MKFPGYDHYITGTAVPVSALRSRESCGIGEFLDLIPFGKFCKKSGIQLIQILPVNDTGNQISPYSALSAYALHPVYLRLQRLAEKGDGEIEALRVKYAQSPRLSFQDVLKEKLRVAYRIYMRLKEEVLADPGLQDWITSNPWVRIYSVYKTLKEMHGLRSWQEWEEMKDPAQDDIHRFWEEHREETRFHAWLQYHLETQLREVSAALENMGVALKGDLPILMSEDSADIWQHRTYFHLDRRAGAPPDMYSREGQNWGFPIYNWEELEKDGFIWWKGRLKQAEKYYHAFRIDHVLGFFRIWAVPEREESAALGYYIPYKYISNKELKAAGFSEERISWLSKPHISRYEIDEKLGAEGEKVLPYLNRIGEEDLYLFSPEIRGTGDINALPLSEKARETLKEWLKNRTLISLDLNQFFNTWHFTASRAYQSLEGEEQKKLYALIDSAGKTSEKNWEKTGDHLLSVIRNSTDMLVCAEDLGAVPACVPRVLEKLGILGLKIGFWTKEYSKPGEPYIPVKNYPFLSVATLSVHDSQIFREWWELSASKGEKRDFCSALEIEDISGESYSPENAELIIRAFLESSSYAAILQIQDFLDLDENLRGEAAQERINIPGTVSDLNWTYRLPLEIEALSEMETFTRSLEKLNSRRREKPLPAESPAHRYSQP